MRGKECLPARRSRSWAFRLIPFPLDHDIRSYRLIARVFAGSREGLTRDDILDNITLTWLTKTAGAHILGEQVPLLPPSERHASNCSERLP